MIPLVSDATDELIPASHFGCEAQIVVHLDFHLARPKSHYTTVPGKLTKNAPTNKRVDVDNLAKFVLEWNFVRG